MTNTIKNFQGGKGFEGRMGLSYYYISCVLSIYKWELLWSVSESQFSEPNMIVPHMIIEIRAVCHLNLVRTCGGDLLAFAAAPKTHRPVVDKSKYDIKMMIYVKNT